MDILRDLEALKQSPICCAFQEEELRHIYGSGNKMSLKKDQVLFSENSVQETLYIILSGRMEVYKKQKQIAIREAGDFLGEMAVLESKHPVQPVSGLSLIQKCWKLIKKPSSILLFRTRK